ncbi:MAG: branched-chain amino acid transport system ATP-binding protein [Betaproteobacteria bacterium]|jgi:branched-chain amino acid transport system ATP-binding protein|nr:branched-chain amino acid transport system ATP-binding protein [Betaproteobacteria bacterium]
MAFALQTEKLCKSFGALTVADHIDFRLEPGSRHALIGPNGAGKTTFVNMLTGVLAPTSGRILMDGEEITRTNQAARVKLGMGRTFQITTLFRSLPVLDNVALSIAERSGLARRMWRSASSHKEIIEESMALLGVLGLADDAAARAQDLPYGKQRLLEIAVTLGLKPKVLLLDEPAAGVPSHDSGKVLQQLEKLSTDIAVLIIEHDMDLVFRFAQRITVLVQGQVLVEGAPSEIAADKRVRDVYLGEGTHA